MTKAALAWPLAESAHLPYGEQIVLEDHWSNIVKEFFQATPDQLADPEFTAKRLFKGAPTSQESVAATTALQIRLAMDNARMLAELRDAVRQSGEASERLQRAANNFSRTAVWLTVFLSIVAALQAAHIIKTW